MYLRGRWEITVTLFLSRLNLNAYKRCPPYQLSRFHLYSANRFVFRGPAPCWGVSRGAGSVVRCLESTGAWSDSRIGLFGLTIVWWVLCNNGHSIYTNTHKFCTSTLITPMDRPRHPFIWLATVKPPWLHKRLKGAGVTSRKNDQRFAIWVPR